MLKHTDRFSLSLRQRFFVHINNSLHEIKTLFTPRFTPQFRKTLALRLTSPRFIQEKSAVNLGVLLALLLRQSNKFSFVHLLPTDGVILLV